MFTGNERFRASAEIGSGVMGVVYRAYDVDTGTDVALKTLHDWDPNDAFALKQEFRSLTSIRHPNLVELYELVATERHCFFTMELVRGVSLLEHLVGVSPDDPRIPDVVAQLVGALHAVHCSGKLHRDIKPSNVMVTASGRVVVLDFGLATTFRGRGSEGATPGRFVGTPRYAAPEQLRGDAPSPPADLYAVGAMLYEALAGRLPFADPVARAFRTSDVSAVPIRALAPGIPRPLETLVENLLARDPQRRPDAAEILRLLGSDRLPRPAALSTVWQADRGLFIGREQEMAALDHLLSRSESRPAVALVHGPSGIGKTSLAAHALNRFEQSHGAIVLTGRCHPQEIVALKGFDEIVDQLTRVVLATRLEPGALAADRVAALTRVFPVLARVPAFGNPHPEEGRADPLETRRRGFVALRELLGLLAARRPIVLWLDDAQWGGADSAALLDELVRDPDPPVRAVLLTFRSDATTPGPLVEPWQRDRVAALDLPVGPLDDESARTLALAVAAETTFDVDEVVDESGGSPFLLSQLGMVDAVPARGGLRDVLSQRIRALGAPARAVLETVAIAANPTDRALILDAAGLAEAGRRVVTALERERFVQLVGTEYRAVEPYHDVVRNTVVGLMESDARVERHRALARAFEAHGATEPDRLAEHLSAAGELVRASHWAAIAAQQSVEALAFAKAARLFRSAREWWPGDAARARALRLGQAEALVNAGQCAEAAGSFLAAADGLSGDAGIELRRRAAEQYLASGHVDDGIATLQPVLRELGLPDPRTPGRAAIGLAVRLAVLRIRGTHVRPTREASAAWARLRTDACYSAAKSFTMIEPVRGIFFSVTGLQEALRAGDPVRIGRHLMMVGGSLASLGGRVGRWADGLMREALALAERMDDPYLTGMTATGMGPAHLIAGEWRLALERSDEGVRILSERCRGVSFDCAIGRMAALRALEELGRIVEVRARGEEMLAGARESGDRYAEVTAGLYVAFALLAAADLTRARALVSEVLREWTRGSFNLQHLGGLQIDVFCDLYEGASLRASERMAAALPAIEASGLLRVPLPRIDVHVLRARAALATDYPSRHVVVEKIAEQLQREGRDDARGHGSMLRAALASRRDDGLAVRRFCGEAVAAYQRAGMVLHAMCAERRIAEADAAVERVADVDVRMRALGVMDAERWAQVYAPGFRATIGV